MPTPLNSKSTLDDIRERFDHDVERFSNLDTGQKLVFDAPRMMDLITRAAALSTPKARNILDIGCGAGNNTLKMLQLLNPLDCTLLDLSQPMLDRAAERISAVNSGAIHTVQGDMRTVAFPEPQYDIIVAAAVLHHLREVDDWRFMFQRLYDITAPGGGVWVTDMVSHESADIQAMLWGEFGDRAVSLGGEAYRDRVLAYIDREDSPRPVTFQMELLREVGFAKVDLLHKNACFAAYGGLKSLT